MVINSHGPEGPRVDIANGVGETFKAPPSTTLKPFIKPAVNFASAERLQGSIHSLPELVDFNAINNATHTFCVQAKSQEPFDTLTHGEFKVAVAKCAAWLKENLPIKKAEGSGALTDMAPVALFMGSDIGLVIHEFALMSIGVPPLVLSPRLPPVAINALLEATAASSFIVSQRLSEPAKPALAALAAKGVSTHIGNPYKTYYQQGADPSTTAPFDLPENPDSIILLLHSSGTTGLPKPIPITHRQLLFAVNCHKFDTEEEAQSLNLSTLPLFHGFGLVAPGLSMSAGKPTLYPANDGIPNARSIVDLIKKSNAKSMMTVPFLLDDITNLPEDEGVKALQHMDFVGTGGAALGAGIGDRLAAGGVKLLNFYGTTETGPLSLTFAPKDDYDWKYFRLRTDCEYKVDELAPKEDERRFRLTVYPYGGTEGFEISDQLIRNERYPETDFAAVGRDDDVIVLATGEKANPLILETSLTETPGIKAAIAFGENQFNLGVIVEPVEPVTAETEAAFKDKIWPIITAAGENLDAYSRIPSSEAVVIVPTGMTVPRTDKGSIARKETYALFDREIKAVYERLLQAASEATEPFDIDNLESHLKDLVHTSLRLQAPPSEWGVEDSIFDVGADSLQALQLRRVLVAAASKTEAFKDVDVAKLIPAEFVYLNPSVREMATALTKGSSSGESSLEEAVKEIEEFVEKYTLTISASEPKVSSSSDDAFVLISGSSGSLGSHIVADLARRPNVQKIVCLIRKDRGTNAPPMPGGNPMDKKVLKSRNITLSDSEWAKIATLEVDPTAEKLGLIPMAYGMMQMKVTHVIHAAWPMNYLLKTRSFQYQFKFLKNLLEFAAQGAGPTKKRFTFVSSIAAVARIGLGNPGNPIAEKPVAPADGACGIGYADGKLVCEKILERAAETYAGQLDITSVRCGQMTGAKNTGVWNANEQIPMLLRSAQTIGSLPQLQGTLSWIPVDDAAATVSEMTFANGTLPIVQHLENPVRQSWEDMVQVFAKELNLSGPVIPFDQWLEQVATAEHSGEDIPVKKLRAFFGNFFKTVACGHVVLDTEVAKTQSPTLSNMRAVSNLVVKAYVDYWKSTGYLRK